MKITADYLRQLINEATQGEMEFAELEAARRAYREDKNDDTRHELGLMVEKLVEPIMAELGLFFEAEAFYNRGEIVFTNYKDMEVTIDPLGMMGRYDVQVVPLPGAEEDFNPVEISLDTMKGVAQFIYDLEEPLGDGMVGEPEAQTELPLENKMRITKSQLQRVIREETKNLKEAVSREKIENYLRDIADGMAADGLNPRAIKMGLDDEFMDNFAGVGVPHGAFEGFIEKLAMDAGGGVRVENKTRVTRSQLQQVIREAIKEEMEDRISGADMLAMYDAEQGLDVMSKEEAMEELENILRDIRKTSNDDRSSQQANRAEDMLRVIVRG